MNDDLLPDGLYDGIPVRINRKISKLGRAYWDVCFRILDPFDKEIHALLLGPEDTELATWVWSKAVAHPLDLLLLPCITLDVITEENMKGMRRNRVRQLLPDF